MRDADTSRQIGAVIIGRNEGARLVTCLASVSAQVDRVVYVDSGSTDNSLAEARAAEAEVIQLDTTVPFTAARARNAGLAHLVTQGTPPVLVQFVDGDCELRAGWIEAANRLMEAQPDIAAVCGRRRERAPEATLYNRLIDLEWNGPRQARSGPVGATL